MSRVEDMLTALVNDSSVDITPRSRIEKYLKNCVEGCGCDGLPPPKSRVEILLNDLAEKLGGGGSGSSGGVTIKNQDKNITENGSYSADSGYTGLGVVKVDVQPKNQDKNITENGSYSADSGYTGLGIVRVNVPVDSKIDELISRTVTEMTEKDFEGATSIGVYAFHSCTSLVSIVIPTTVKSIGEYAFEGCTNLVVYYKGTMEEWDAISIKSLNNTINNAPRYYYSENEPTIAGNFWHYVDGVITTWPTSSAPSIYSEGLEYKLENDSTYTVKGIGTCTDTDVNIPPSIDGVPVRSINYNAFLACTSFTSVIIPDSVTSIRNYAFLQCSNLASINIPNSVTSIGIGALNGCSNLTSINIPNSVTIISENMMGNCSKLTIINILGSVTKIESSAFQNCTAMETYDFTSCTAVPTLSNANAFNSIPSTCQIKVPASLYDEWIAATNWSTYASNIVAV